MVFTLGNNGAMDINKKGAIDHISRQHFIKQKNIGENMIIKELSSQSRIKNVTTAIIRKK